MATVHVVGAGVAGLAAAVRLTAAGRTVAVYEGAPQTGGRCRSFYDETLGRTIDNGNHLLLAGNRSAMAYLGEIGAGPDALMGPAEPAFGFLDLASGRRWTVRPNRGPVPWWIFAPGRRAPDSRARDYLAAGRLLRARPTATVAECFEAESPAFRRFWEPIAVAVLNASAEEGAASLLRPLVREIFLRGGGAVRPLIARAGLSEAFIAPACARLAARGTPVQVSCRLRALAYDGDRVSGLQLGTGTVPLAVTDSVVLAVPPAAAARLVPGLVVPTESRAIVNAHFRLEPAPPAASGVPFLGILGGLAQWLFVRGDIASVTVSAADALAERPEPELAARLWADACRALDRPAAPLPRARIIKEKRATFAQVPAALDARAGVRTGWRNLFLAGDWTDTGLPATIEGAAHSGHLAAAAILAN